MQKNLTVQGKGSTVMISVIIAASKGEYYIEESIRSVLSQLSFDDEIIVSDEMSGGATGRVVKRLADEDSRVIYVEGKIGRVENTVNAIRHSSGDKIFICSQSDVWLPDKIKRVNEAFDEGASLVVHNAYITDEALNIKEYSYFSKYNCRKGLISNLAENTFFGPLMAFDRKMLKFIMPIPKHIPEYDLWIGVICRIFGTVRLIDLPLSYHRELQPREKTDKKTAKNNRRYMLGKLYKRLFIRK